MSNSLAELLAAAGQAPFGGPSAEEIYAAGMNAFGLDGGAFGFGASAFGAGPMVANRGGMINQAALNAAALANKRAAINAANTPLNQAPVNTFLGKMPLAMNSGSTGGLPFIVPAAGTQRIQGTPNVDFQPFRYVTGTFAAGAGFLVTQPTMGINGSFASGDPVDASTLSVNGQGLEIKFPLVKANTPVNATVTNYSAVASPFVSTLYGYMQQ